jgi:hypothetical protein
MCVTCSTRHSFEISHYKIFMKKNLFSLHFEGLIWIWILICDIDFHFSSLEFFLGVRNVWMQIYSLSCEIDTVMCFTRHKKNFIKLSILYGTNMFLSSTFFIITFTHWHVMKGNYLISNDLDVISIYSA